jgi:putative chitinase
MTFEFEFTPGHLEAIIGNNQHIGDWHDALSQMLPNYEITSVLRASAFIAQCAHESARFARTTENLNYKPESLRRVFPKYFPTDALANQYGRKPEMIANRVYANRMGNGPEESGDGWQYKGRGLIQLTGKNNYTLFAESTGMQLEDVPDYLETFTGAVQSACWFWNTNNLNKWADNSDIVTLTKRINGGTHGLDDRKQLYTLALSVLGN